MNLQFGKNICLLQRTYTSDREKVVAILYNLYLSLSLSHLTALTFLFILMECMHLKKNGVHASIQVHFARQKYYTESNGLCGQILYGASSHTIRTQFEQASRICIF